MPYNGDCSDNKSEHWNEARRQVRAKFPQLMEGSSGWHRAVKNRFHRIYAQRF